MDRHILIQADPVLREGATLLGKIWFDVSQEYARDAQTYIVVYHSDILGKDVVLYVGTSISEAENVYHEHIRKVEEANRGRI